MITHMYRRPAKGGIFWFDARDGEYRWRESLGTRDKHEAEERLAKRREQLEIVAKAATGAPPLTTKAWRHLTIAEAVERYAEERRADVSERMVVYWEEQARPLVRFFGERKLKQLTPGCLRDYQKSRLGRAPKTINGELSVLRQLLRRSSLWYRFRGYRELPKTEPSIGRALTDEEQQRLYETAVLWKQGMPKLVKVGKDGKIYHLRPNWMFAYCATMLSFFLGMRSIEIRHLRWKDVDFVTGVVYIRRSKTPKGHRAPTLNEVCRVALSELHEAAKLTTGAEAEHFIFPAGGTDATQPMKSWRTAWRSLRTAAGLEGLRMHDGRHTAVTGMAESGIPEHVIEAHVGHSQLVRDYLKIRRGALNAASAALQPAWLSRPDEQVEMVN